MSPPTEANDKYVIPCGVILAWNITKPIIVIGILFNDPGKVFKNQNYNHINCNAVSFNMSID